MRILVQSMIAMALAGTAGVSKGETPMGGTTRVLDPAVQKCVDDGYEVLQVRDNYGIPRRSLCFDRRSNRKCESWEYYVGKCTLDGRPRPVLKTLPSIRGTSAPGIRKHCGKSNCEGREYNYSVTLGGCASRHVSDAPPAGVVVVKKGDASK